MPWNSWGANLRGVATVASCRGQKGEANGSWGALSGVFPKENVNFESISIAVCGIN